MKSAALLMFASLVLPPVCLAQGADSMAAAVAKSLRSAQYRNVQITVRGNTVTLTGSVALYSTREDAEDQVRQIRGIGTIRNEIQVDTPATLIANSR